MKWNATIEEVVFEHNFLRPCFKSLIGSFSFVISFALVLQSFFKRRTLDILFLQVLQKLQCAYLELSTDPSLLPQPTPQYHSINCRLVIVIKLITEITIVLVAKKTTRQVN